MRIATDSDSPTMHNAMMEPAERHQVLDIVVTANRTMMTMMQLHHRCGAAGPHARAVASVHGTTKMWSECGGASTKVERVSVVFFEHGLHAGIAGEPSGCVSPQYNASRFENISSAGFDPEQGSWVQQRVDGNMNNDLCGEPRSLKLARDVAAREFAHA